MTDKLMGGMDPAARAAAADAAAKKEGNLAENIRASVSPGSGLKPSDTAASRPRLAGNGPIGSLKKTVKDMPAIDSGMDMNAMQTRRLTLDSNASYGMKVKRPPSDESAHTKCWQLLKVLLLVAKVLDPLGVFARIAARPQNLAV